MMGNDEYVFNGRFKRLRDHFEKKPDTALRTLYSDVERMDGLHSFAVTEEFTVEADEPEGLGGTNKAPTPTALLLSAMAHCQAITLKMYARAMEIELDDVKVKVTGTVDLRGYMGLKDEAGKPFDPGLEEVVIKTFIESKETEGRILALIEASRQKGVSLSSVKPKKGLRISYRLNGKRIG